MYYRFTDAIRRFICDFPDFRHDQLDSSCLKAEQGTPPWIILLPQSAYLHDWTVPYPIHFSILLHFVFVHFRAIHK